MSKSHKEKILFVTTAKDSVPGSLRDAINKANSFSNTIIIIKKSVGDRIVLKYGEIDITSNIKLINKTKNDLTICSKKQNQRLFHIFSSAQVLEITSCNDKKMFLSGGKHDLNGGAFYIESDSHQLILNNVVISGNAALGSGGAIYTFGSVTLLSSIVELNEAGVQGGGIWSGKGVTLEQSKVSKNSVLIPDESSGGAGIFVDDGNCILNESCVSDNHVAYDADKSVGGSGGLVVMTGSIYVQNNSHVDNNTAFNSAGIQEGNGNVYVTNKSSVNNNQSFNAALAAGGGGITISIGTVFVSNSEVCDNKTVGMYSGGIVSIFGDVIVSDHSKINGNTNRGPGGGIACNLGSVSIGSGSSVSHNTGASLAAAIVTFSPSPAFISISGNSVISHNTLTNAQTIAQTILAFIGVVTGNLSGTTKQANKSGGSGGASLIKLIPGILSQLTSVSDLLKALPIEKIGPANVIGGTVASLLSGEINIENSRIENNYVGKNVSAQNSPFSGFGGGVFGFGAPINIQNSIIKNNTSLSSGSGIWSNSGVNASNSSITENHIKVNGNGGGIFNGSDSIASLINTCINHNSARGNGGGIYNTGQLTLISSTIKKNTAKINGGGVFSNKPFVDIDTTITDNTPNDVVIIP